MEGKGWCDVYPNKLLFTFGCFYICANFGKIHQEMHACRWTYGHRQTGFVICPMLYAIAMGQTIN